MVVRSKLFEIPNLPCELSTRRGVPPRTTRVLPHLQLDQFPPVEIAGQLIERSLALPYVRCRQSRMADPKTWALWLPDEFAAGPADAFIDGHEFCLLHPLPESSIHLTLPEDLRETAIRLGWAEPHPASYLGLVPPTLVLVYAPQNSSELNSVLQLIRDSYEFARGM